MSRTLGIILAFLLVPVVGVAQEQKIKVSLDIRADETLKPQVLSCMRNSLRGIRDVELVDKSYDYKININAQQTLINTQQSPIGYEFCITVRLYIDIKKLIMMSIWPILRSNSLEFNLNINSIAGNIMRGIENNNNIKFLSDNFQYLEIQILLSMSNLKDACNQYVTEIDTLVFEDHRRIDKEKRRRYHEGKGSVLNAQSILNKYGFYTGPIDGIIGPKTRDALRKYQASKGLVVTGRLGELTLGEINWDDIQSNIQKR